VKKHCKNSVFCFVINLFSIFLFIYLIIFRLIHNYILLFKSKFYLRKNDKIIYNIIMNKLFSKNDNGFICQNCGANVPPLKYSSRDHCNKCLHSLHVDVCPGDRQNDCLGLMEPIEVIYKSSIYDIKYRCKKCGEMHNNKSAKDDSFETILKIMQQCSLR